MKNKTIPYLTGRLFDGISSGLFMMALPWVMLQTPNMGTFVALVALACTVVSFLLTPLFSTYIDRHSRKFLLILNQGIQSLTAGVVMLAYWYDWSSYWLLAGAQLFIWVSSNFAWAANNAFTQENYDRDEYAAISSYQEIVMQGTTLGAGALGVMLLQIWGMFEFALFAAVASALAAFSYTLTPYRQQLRPKSRVPFFNQLIESKSIFSQSPKFYGFLMISCLSYPILTFLGKLVPISFSEQGLSGQWYAAYNISFGLGSLLTGFLLQQILAKFSLQNTIQYAMFFVALMLFGMSISSEPELLMVFTFGFGFFNAINRIARTNWMHHTIAIEQRGRVDGGLAMFSTLAQSLSYVMIALLSHYQHISMGFAIAAVVVLIASIMMLNLGRTLTGKSSLDMKGATANS
ncbi:MFS transporter [Vibrio genomosp. F10]|uniref:MFS transporter n=1 Tax=Vibrio genomosp. F10 str. ZF-129 TaxID=1187848 RepID=A0A1E5B9R6_9VIBR|nr:MFS transporter [Vibrio genomosp. F10]OEE30659.1 MFS transporter [Vibrio genomosp. F10 str. ZF-129]OEE94797.1 MFS transporter [Vibrio genomosp. F10 str. 9ZC157]OEF08403.1 MFS transporter [Vibrio genomosp. F10 str. 9ZB36]OEF18612.1 MFS transporter [Vibrio genomosp. F10 str. 9ZD137]